MKTVICQPGDTNFSEHFSSIDSEAPYLRKGIAITQDGIARASACLYHNPALLHNGSPLMLAGNFTCADDTGIADALFSAMDAATVEDGISYIAGPVSGSVWNDYRVPVSGRSCLFYGDLQQPLYYAGLFCDHGFQVIHRYHSYISDIPETGSDLISFPPGVSIVPVHAGNLEQYLPALHELSNKAFKDNPFFSPIDKDAFIRKYLQMKPLIDERMTMIAVKDGQLIAFLFAYADPSAPQTVVVKTIAKHPDHNIPGLITNMLRLLFSGLGAAGYTRAVHAFMHEDNRSLLRSRDFGGSILRSYALFGKNILH